MSIENLRNVKYCFPEYDEEIPYIQFHVTNEIYKRLDDVKVIEVYQDNGTVIDCYVPDTTPKEDEEFDEAIKEELDCILSYVRINSLVKQR